MALGWTPLSWASTVLNASAARANASRGCAQISNRLEVTPPAANSPAITADAFDSSAKAKFFSSSTKTRSPGNSADVRRAVSNNTGANQFGEFRHRTFHGTFLYVCFRKGKGSADLPRVMSQATHRRSYHIGFAKRKSAQTRMSSWSARSSGSSLSCWACWQMSCCPSGGP